MTSVAITGIAIENRIMGALVANTSSSPRGFLEKDIILLHALANLTATALQKYRLSQEHRRRTRELEMLTLVSSSLRQAEKSEDMLPILVNNAREVFSADIVIFYLEDTWSKPLPGVMPQRHALHAPDNSREVLFVSRTHTIWKIAEGGSLHISLMVNELEAKFGREILYRGLEGLPSFALSSVEITDGVIALLFFLVLVLLISFQMTSAGCSRRYLRWEVMLCKEQERWKLSRGKSIICCTSGCWLNTTTPAKLAKIS
jgi:hypothetical protein